jgi:hypothetical protein
MRYLQVPQQVGNHGLPMGCVFRPIGGAGLQASSFGFQQLGKQRTLLLR